MLRVVGNRLLPPNAVMSTEVPELVGGELTPIVGPQHLDLLSSFVLHQSFELFEPSEDLTLGLQEIDLGFPGEVINERHIVLVTTQR